MKRIRRVCLILAALLLSLAGQEAGAQEVTRRPRLDLRVGTRLSSHTVTSPGGVVKTTEAGGIVASIGYVHWLQERWALTATGTLLTAKVESSDSYGKGWQTDKAYSIPLLLGLRRYLGEPPEGSKWAPWLSAEAGPVMGLEVASDTYGSGTGSGSRTAVGARFALGTRAGLGLDVRLTDLVTVGGSVRYTFVPGFLDTGGDQSNQNGVDVGLRVSLRLNPNDLAAGG